MQLPPDEEEQEGNGEDGCEDSEPPCCVNQEYQRQGRKQALQGKTDCRTHTDGAINSLVFCVFLTTGIGHEVDNLGREHLRQGVGSKDGKDSRHGRQRGEDAHQQEEIEDEGDDAISADMGILHDGEDALSVGSPTKTIEEVGESVFVKRTRHQEAHDDRQDDCDGERQDVARAEEGGRHDTTRQPPREGPVFHDCGVSLLGRLMQSPEGETGEEDEGGMKPVKNTW